MGKTRRNSRGHRRISAQNQRPSEKHLCIIEFTQMLKFHWVHSNSTSMPPLLDGSHCDSRELMKWSSCSCFGIEMRIEMREMRDTLEVTRIKAVFRGTIEDNLQTLAADHAQAQFPEVNQHSKWRSSLQTILEKTDSEIYGSNLCFGHSKKPRTSKFKP